jgi:histidinol-phosphate aminotransferase
MTTKMNIRTIIDATLRADVLAMQPYHVPDATGMIKLDAMENPYTLPPTLQAEVAKAMATVATNRYPDPQAKTLQATLRKALGIPDELAIIFGNGSDELISIITTACGKPGAKVLAPVPTFVMYEVSAKLAGLEFVPVDLQADFSVNTDAMLSAIAEHKPNLVWLAYPNNPTGNLFAPESIDAIIEAVLKTSAGLVVIDEAYQTFASDSYMQRIAQQPEKYPNVIVLRTLSKTGLAGIRLGYALGAPAWIERLDCVRPPYNINVLTQAYAKVVLEHKLCWMNKLS